MNREQSLIAESVKSLLELLSVVTQLENQLIEKPRDLNFMTDTIFLCRKCEDLLQMMRKSLNSLSDKVETQCCELLMALSESKWSNENATISPNPSLYVKFPTSPKDQNFAEFVKQLPTDAIRPHYPTVTELILKDVGEGKQIPFGLKNIEGVNLKVRLTSKRDL
jgi:hypothetical protein